MKEVAIEAVEAKEGCKGCIFRVNGCSDYIDDSIKILGLPTCDEGYIYKIKEK